MTYALERKPAFAAMARAPAERLRPAVQTPAAVGRASLRGASGLAVAITPQAAGPIVVELRRGAAVRARARLTGHAGQRATARLRIAAAGAGTYVVVVRAPRAASVRRSVRIR